MQPTIASEAGLNSHLLLQEGGRGAASLAVSLAVSLPATNDGYGSVRSVAIVGGGPVGMALALALHYHGIPAEIFEARTRADVRQDTRVLALSDGSRQILEWLGVWPQHAATPIHRIHISHRGSLGRTRLSASQMDVPALGWVLPAARLITTLDAAVSAAGIVYHEQQKVGAGKTPTNTSSQTKVALTAWAEGAVNTADATTNITAHDYAQHAVLCQAHTAQPHNHMAWERFTDEGPVALLPLGKAYAIVLTCAAVDVARIAALTDADFLALLQQRFGTRHRFISVTPRETFALDLRYRQQPVGEREVWLGNAAQTLHPVAGQGFNLALRDVWELARTLHHAPDPGSPDRLAAYAKSRQLDRRGAIGFTHALINIFASTLPPVRHARGAGLLALDLLSPLKNFVARRMIFGARAW
ncbi:FAD-dependent monooxygenase [Rugosibacter aromaticivorans]|uniref:FAD-dependent monooxygenase n=1 Tax=Rugosibacter aromaticivorans TaxID=1565605 RepID=UPI000ADB37F8|nr:FAD-dependent monooxygenase [Rugosibacter aromaticivorans]TBR14624.1 MAG: 2-octaprenyl-6-methoxyphenyl hydroxylase [Rugosibacter sp.]